MPSRQYYFANVLNGSVDLNMLTYLSVTYPNNSVELSHGDLLRPLHGRGDLLLMLLRQERQNLRNYRV